MNKKQKNISSSLNSTTMQVSLLRSVGSSRSRSSMIRDDDDDDSAIGRHCCAMNACAFADTAASRCDGNGTNNCPTKSRVIPSKVHHDAPPEAGFSA